MAVLKEFRSRGNETIEERAKLVELDTTSWFSRFSEYQLKP